MSDPGGAPLTASDELLLLPTPADPLDRTASFSGAFAAFAGGVPGKAEAAKKVNLIIRDEVHWYGRKVCGYKD